MGGSTSSAAQLVASGTALPTCACLPVKLPLKTRNVPSIPNGRYLLWLVDHIAIQESVDILATWMFYTVLVIAGQH